VRLSSRQRGQTGCRWSKWPRRKSQLPADHDCWAARWNDFAGRRRDRGDTARMIRHVADSPGRHSADQNCRRTHGEHSRSGRYAARQHARCGCIGDPGCRRAADQHGRFALDDRKRHRWMRHRCRRWRRRMNRRVAVRRILQNVVTYSGCRFSHCLGLFVFG
jgi:hypothetical protein